MLALLLTTVTLTLPPPDARKTFPSQPAWEAYWYRHRGRLVHAPRREAPWPSVRMEIEAALRSTLEDVERARHLPDVLVALAKVAPADDSEVIEVLEAQLSASPQAAQAAALALCVRADLRTADLLRALADDVEDVVLRPYAVLGLARIGGARGPAERKAIADELVVRLAIAETRDVRLASVMGLAICAPPGHSCVDRLARLLGRSDGDVLLRMQVAFALGWLGREDVRARQRLAQFAIGRGLDDPTAEIVEACALAVAEWSEADPALQRALVEATERDDPNVRGAALLAVARLRTIGAKELLLRRLDSERTDEAAFAALGLGLLGRARLDALEPLDRSIDHALVRALSRTSNPELAGALSLAVGLREHWAAVPVLLDVLARFREDAPRGHAAFALGLIGAPQARGVLLPMIAEAKYRPRLRREVALALARLGEPRVVGELLEALATSEGLSSQASALSPLGLVCDQRVVPALLAILVGAEKTEAARGFAAEALGRIVTPEPWNLEIGALTLYRAEPSRTPAFLWHIKGLSCLDPDG